MSANVGHHRVMPDTHRPGRRLGPWFMVMAGGVLLISVGVVVSWFWLPRWKPEWVLTYSPWVDPLLRTDPDVDSSRFGLFEERITSLGPGCFPALRGLYRLGPITSPWLTRARLVSDDQGRRLIDHLLRVLAHPPVDRAEAARTSTIWKLFVHSQDPAWDEAYEHQLWLHDEDHWSRRKP